MPANRFSRSIRTNAFAGVLLLVASAVLQGCLGLSASVHSPGEAAAAATQFGQYAFVNGDTERAYLMLAPELASNVSTEQLAADLREMHADARPGSIRDRVRAASRAARNVDL